ncbi:hypothetical protein K440DRAFT_152268 [Wilcoxina mikolae CBS 423.85]|nr:hypothetical protein K440DRAFT_152268 [Wilcoxina mikolae CBS 423.85]
MISSCKCMVFIRLQIWSPSLPKHSHLATHGYPSNVRTGSWVYHCRLCEQVAVNYIGIGREVRRVTVTNLYTLHIKDDDYCQVFPILHGR